MGILLADSVRDDSQTVMLPGEAIGNSAVSLQISKRARMRTLLPTGCLEIPLAP